MIKQENKTGISFEAKSFFTITFYRVDANVYTNVDAKSEKQAQNRSRC